MVDNVSDRYEYRNLKRNLHDGNIISIKKFGSPWKRNHGIPLDKKNTISTKKNVSPSGRNYEISFPRHLIIILIKTLVTKLMSTESDSAETFV